MTSWILTLDELLLLPFRLPHDPLVGYWLGCAMLALAATAIGDGTAQLARWVNRRPLAEASEEALARHAEAMAALRGGDREAYAAANKIANEAFGRWFFHSAAVGISALWPAFFAAAWLNVRFAHVVFPLPFTDTTASFVAPLIVWIVVFRTGLSVVRRLRRKPTREEEPTGAAPLPLGG